jgi:hypothetical protein
MQGLSAPSLDSNASLHLAYITLQTLIYRALLRSFGRSRTSPNRNQAMQFSGRVPTQTQEPIVSDHLLDPTDAPNTELQIAAEEALMAAIGCAELATKFTRNLTSRDFSGFWYSCMFINAFRFSARVL